MDVIACGMCSFPFHEIYTTQTSHRRHVCRCWSLTLITIRLPGSPVRQATILGREHVDQLGALAHGAPETLDGKSTASLCPHLRMQVWEIVRARPRRNCFYRLLLALAPHTSVRVEGDTSLSYCRSVSETCGRLCPFAFAPKHKHKRTDHRGDRQPDPKFPNEVRREGRIRGEGTEKHEDQRIVTGMQECRGPGTA